MGGNTRPDDGELRVHYSDFEFLEMDGRDVTSPQMQKMLAPALAMTSAIPDYLVTAEGEFVRADGMDELVSRFVKALSASRGQEEAERLGEMMARPEMKELLAAAVSNYWNSWVGAWVGWDVAPGEAATVDTQLPLMGVEIPAKLTVEHHGDAADAAGCVRLSMHSVAAGEGAARALARALAVLASGAGQDEISQDALADVFVENKTVVVTDPKTLCPRSVLTEKVVRITEKGKTEPRQQIERHHYVFDWGSR